MQDFFLRLTSKAKETPEDAGQPPEVRVAVYDSLLSPPQIVSLSAEDFNELVGELASRTHAFARERGGRIPLVVIREIIERLIQPFVRDVHSSITHNVSHFRST